jgi:hypothetical protein
VNIRQFTCGITVYDDSGITPPVLMEHQVQYDSLHLHTSRETKSSRKPFMNNSISLYLRFLKFCIIDCTDPIFLGWNVTWQSYYNTRTKKFEPRNVSDSIRKSRKTISAGQDMTELLPVDAIFLPYLQSISIKWNQFRGPLCPEPRQLTNHSSL